MSQKTYAFKVTEEQEKFIELEAQKISENPSVVLRGLIERGMNKKESLEEIDSVKKITQKQIDSLTSNVASIRFEIKQLYIGKFGESRAKELRIRADELGAKKLEEIKS